MRYSKEYYTAHLSNDIWLADDVSVLLGMEAEGAHTHTIHCPENISEKEMIGRIVEKNRSYGIFESREDADDLIKNLITIKAPEIADWLYTKRRDYSDRQDFQRKCITMDMGEVVGHGFTRDFKEMQTPVITVVLQRNRDEKKSARYGFYLVTAYPDLNSEKAIPTGREYTRQEIVTGGMYDFRTPLEKAAFLCENQGRIKVKYLESFDSEPYLRLYCQNKDTWYYAYIAQDQQRYMCRPDNAVLKRYVSYQELKESCPDLAEMAQKAMVIAGTKAHTVDERISDAKIRADKIYITRSRFADTKSRGDRSFAERI